jgi:hypothetical protein
MNVALDIDGTITKAPQFFSFLSRSVRETGGKVFVVTSRANIAGVDAQTRQELVSYAVEFDELCIIPDAEDMQMPCPHHDLDWNEKYLWQKVKLCIDRNVEVVFEDDLKVLDLFARFAPDIQVFQVR